jgi:hypothetical protein
MYFYKVMYAGFRGRLFADGESPLAEQAGLSIL